MIWILAATRKTDPAFLISMAFCAVVVVGGWLLWKGFGLILGTGKKGPDPAKQAAIQAFRRHLDEAVTAGDPKRIRAVVGSIEERGLAKLDVPGLHALGIGWAELLEFLAGERATHVTPDDIGARALQGEPCRGQFRGVEFDRRGDNDEKGTLYVGDKSLVFVGSGVTAVPLSKVVKVATEVPRDEWSRGRPLLVTRSDRENPTRFVFQEYGAALIAARVLEEAIAARGKA